MEEKFDFIAPERRLTKKEELYCYSYDATEHRHMPDLVLRPISKEEVVRIVKVASKEGMPIVPRGAGTSLSGGPVPVKGGIVLDLTLMNKIKKIDLENSLVVLGPGVVYAKLNNVLERHGFFFPPDPGSGKVCTIGGMVANNSSGIRAVKYGTTKDYVLGLKVVLPSGEIIKLGSKARKSSSGYDLPGLFVGSEGTLGIFTQMTLRVIPRPTHYATARISFNSLEEATKAVSRIIAMGISPAVLELLDYRCLATIKKFSKQAFPDVKAMLLIEVDGFSKDISEELHKAVEICWEENAIDVKESKSEEEREKLWEARKATLPSLARYKPTLILEDVTVSVSNLSILMRKIEAIAKRHGVEIATFGHAGDGNLHPTFLVDRRNKEEIEKTKEAVKELFEETLKLGGTLTGEHGIGIEKKGFIHLEHSNSLELMRGIKIAVDPKNIMNPGKIFEV